MEPESGLNLNDYLAVLRRRSWLMAAIAVPILLIGAILALVLPDVYRSTATFRLVTDRVADTAETNIIYSDQYVFGLGDKVLTAQTLKAILAEVNPYPNAGDDEQGAALRRLRTDISIGMVTQTVLDGGGRGREIITGFSVSYINRFPDKAEQVAARLSRAFVEIGREEQLQAANNRLSYLMGETERLRLQVVDFERRLAQFKSANFDRLPEVAQASISMRGRLEQELDGVEREIRTLQQNRVFVVQQLRQAQAGPAAGNLRQLEDEYARRAAIYADNHPDLISLRRQIDLLRQGGTVASGSSLKGQIDQQRAALAEARQRYSEDHPDIRRIVRNIEVLEGQLAAGDLGAEDSASESLMAIQLRTQLNAIDTQIAGLQARAGALRSRMSQLDERLGATPEVEREYQELTRGLGSAQEQLTQLINRRLDAEADVVAITGGAADRFFLAAAPGTPWAPSGPPRLGYVVVSLLLAVVLMFGAVVFAELLDPTVRGARDLRAIMGFSPLSIIPVIDTPTVRAHRLRKMVVMVISLLVGTPVIFLFIHRLTA